MCGTVQLIGVCNLEGRGRYKVQGTFISLSHSAATCVSDCLTFFAKNKTFERQLSVFVSYMVRVILICHDK